MHYVYMLLVGLVVGILARFLHPGRVPMAILGSALSGIAGSCLAGLIGRPLHRDTASASGPQQAGILYSILGAMVLIFIGRLHLI